MRKFLNNYSEALTADINATQTSITVSRGANLPALYTSDDMLMTLKNDTNIEIIRVTNHAASPTFYTLTVQRNVITDTNLNTQSTGTGFAFLAANTTVSINDTADILNRVGMINKMGEDPLSLNAFNYSGASAIYNITLTEAIKKYLITSNGAGSLTINPIDSTGLAESRAFCKTWILFERSVNTYNWPQIRYNYGASACPIEGSPPASNLHAVLEITHCGQHPYVHFKWLTLAANL